MTPPESDKLLALFAAAADAPAPPVDTHPADDDETIAAFATGALTPLARRQLLAHLTACTPCRRRFAELARDGTLAALRDSVTPAARPRPLAWRNRRVAIGGLLAASLLVAVFGLWWVQSTPGRALAEATADLDSGRTGEAFDRLERVATERLSAEERRRHTELLERAAYGLGRDALTDGRFDAVGEVERRAAANGAKSGRLTNLTIQAARSDRQESRLSSASLLLDRGVIMNGQQVVFKSARPDADTDARFRKAMEQFPDDPTLLTNYGEFLIEKVRYDEAVDVFTRAANAAPDAPAPHTGLGLALFKLKRPTDALPHFLTAERLGHGLAAVNAALCHEALGDRRQANVCWQRALPLVTSADLRQQIEETLMRE